jgi:hypothetical protein
MQISKAEFVSKIKSYSVSCREGLENELSILFFNHLVEYTKFLQNHPVQ